MRILHIASNLATAAGGPSVALAGLARAQAAMGDEVAVVSGWNRDAPGAEEAEALAADGVEVSRIGPCLGPLKRHPRLARTVRRAAERADVVHAHGLWEEAQWLAFRESRRRGRPFVLRPCGMLDPWSLGQSRWRKRLYRAWRLDRMVAGAAALHFTTAEERRLARPATGGARGFILPNGLDPAEFERLPPRGRLRGRLGVGDRPMALFLGRIHPKKGLDLLVEAFAEASLPEGAALVIAGGDLAGHLPEVRALARRADPGGERILFAGELRGGERIEALVDADLFVLPSRQENFGIAVAEAMACGAPVVVSDRVNLAGVVERAGAGAVVPLGGGALSRSLGEWMGDAGRRRAAGDRGRRFAMARLLWPRLAGRLRAVYRKLGAGA